MSHMRKSARRGSCAFSLLFWGHVEEGRKSVELISQYSFRVGCENDTGLIKILF